MATRTKTVTNLSHLVGDNVRVVTWTGLLNTDDGEPFEMPGWADRSVQVTGTLGVGGNLRLEGSNDGTNYVALTDPQGNALDISTLKIEAISELTRYVRPRITAGDGTTSLDCILCVGSQKAL